MGRVSATITASPSSPKPLSQNGHGPRVCEVAVITSSIMRTVESLLTNALKRFVGPICDVAETRAPRPVREGNQRLRHSKCLSALLLDSHSEARAGDATTEQAAQDC